ncbi:hypothetical protein GIB67_021577 [Kingdonia uniflora]|uniref:Hyaluronan/mRNA-binding protein domain-containing protein n=1 Tax=Kingdonia uniflora TaxID=39325 RepID=A0A7J7MDU0_9MAGN|nr:hypothetical protein GIB67_021577 [Kingdonia uniflora]
MASRNPFDLLGDEDNDDPSQLAIAAQQKQKLAPAKPVAAAAATQPTKGKLPSKPLPPAQAVRETKNEGRGGGRGGNRGLGRGRVNDAAFNRDQTNNENTFSNNGGYGEGRDNRNISERRGGYGGSRGGYRGGFNNGNVGDGERFRRQYERHSGTGRGSDFKREGAGRGNWGNTVDEIAQEAEASSNVNQKISTTEKQPEGEAVNAKKDDPVKEPEEKEPEDKEMTLEEYQKVLEEKRKALDALKSEERKVDVDKDLKSMQQLSSKKTNDEIFIKLGSDKDKRKEIADKEDKAKKSVSIHEFLKPAYGGGRGRGRGRGSRGGSSGGNVNSSTVDLSIGDPGQFPTLGAK